MSVFRNILSYYVVCKFFYVSSGSILQFTELAFNRTSLPKNKKQLKKKPDINASQHLEP